MLNGCDARPFAVAVILTSDRDPLKFVPEDWTVIVAPDALDIVTSFAPDRTCQEVEEPPDDVSEIDTA